MSDYHRTTLAFPITERPTGELVATLLGTGLREVLAGDPMFRTFETTPDMYTRPVADEWPGSPPNRVDDIRGATFNILTYVSVRVGEHFYDTSIRAYRVPRASTDDPVQTFFRISFPSYVIYKIRGTREYGGEVRIDAAAKSGVLRVALGAAAATNSAGFVYALEDDGMPPLRPAQLFAWAKDPEGHPLPTPPTLVAVDQAVVSRAELLRVWEDPALVLQSGRYNIVDLLQDRDAEVEDDDDAEEPD